LGDIFGGGGGTSSGGSSASLGDGSTFDMSSIAGGDITNIPVAGVNAPFDASTSGGVDPTMLASLFSPSSSFTQTTDPTGSLAATQAVTGSTAGAAPGQDPAAAIGGGTQSAGAPAPSSGQAQGSGQGGGGDAGKADPQRAAALSTLRTLLTSLAKPGGQNPWVTGATPTRAEATAQGSPAAARDLFESDTAHLAKAGELQAALPAANAPAPAAAEAVSTAPPQTTVVPKSTERVPQDASPSPTEAPGQGFGPLGGIPTPESPLGPPGAPQGQGMPNPMAQLAMMALMAGLGGRRGGALLPLIMALMRGQRPGMMGPRRPGWPQPGAWRNTMGGPPIGPNASASNPFVNTLVGAESSGQNVYSRTDRDPAGPNSRASGFLQIDMPTWQEYAGNVPGARRWDRAINAPPDIQLAVGLTIPIHRWGQRTKDALHAKFGPFSEKLTLGQLAAHFGGDTGRMLVAGAPVAGATPVESSGPPGSIRPPRRGPRMEVLQPSE